MYYVAAVKIVEGESQLEDVQLDAAFGEFDALGDMVAKIAAQ